MNLTTEARAAALAACECGLSVLPPKEDGSKAPLAEEHAGEFTWRHRQRTPATRDEVNRWYARGRSGVGVVCGLVSGGRDGRSLVALDFDDPGAWRAYLLLAEASGLGELLGRVEAGYCEKTPKGGRHLLAFCAGRHETTKLALRPDGDGRLATLIETKCEGGYLVVAPSGGPVHPSGRPYVLLSGGFDAIAEVTPEEWRSLCDLAACLDESPHLEGADPNSANSANSASAPRPREGGGEPPGAAFAAQATWSDILIPHGWTLVTRRGDVEYWRRPGKPEGISATTNHAGSGNLKVFSTSTPFQTRGTITKFGAYALLECGGDHSAAAKKLASLGFGSPRPATPRGRSQNSQNSRNTPPGPEDGESGQAAEAAEPEPWPEPVLDTFLGAVPFPLDVLPPPLAEFVAVAAEARSCPADFPALAALGVASGAIGRSVAVHVKEDWRESAALYLGLVGDPGTAKTPAVKAATRPLGAIAHELIEMHRREKELAEGREDAPEPVLKRIAVNDATVESLAPVLQANPRGVVMVRDELSALFAGHNQYKAGGKGADRQFYLSAWSGTDITVDRKASPVPISIREPYLAIVGGIQPAMLSEMNEAKGRDDGFLDRVLFAYPERVPYRWSEAGIRGPLLDAWEAAVRTLWIREMIREDDGSLRPFVSAFGGAAKEAFVSWIEAHSAESEGDDFPPHLRGPWLKFLSYCARLALVLDRLAAAYDPIDSAPSPELSLATAEGAIRLVEYFKTHTRRVRALMRGATGENPDARAVLRWIRQGNRSRFTEREAHTNFRARFPADGPELPDALRWLESRRCIRPLAPPDRRGPGRYPSPGYEVNPALLGAP